MENMGKCWAHFPKWGAHPINHAEGALHGQFQRFTKHTPTQTLKVELFYVPDLLEKIINYILLHIIITNYQINPNIYTYILYIYIENKYYLKERALYSKGCVSLRRCICYYNQTHKKELRRHQW